MDTVLQGLPHVLCYIIITGTSDEEHIRKLEAVLKRLQYHEQAFEQAKRKLTSATVLAHFDPQLPLRLAGDASTYGVGAVISHVLPDGSERPVAYASRTLTASERNYPQLEKEALSLVFGVKNVISTYMVALSPSTRTINLSQPFSTQAKAFLHWQRLACRDGHSSPLTITPLSLRQCKLMPTLMDCHAYPCQREREGNTFRNQVF